MLLVLQAAVIFTSYRYTTNLIMLVAVLAILPSFIWLTKSVNFMMLLWSSGFLTASCSNSLARMSIRSKGYTMHSQIIQGKWSTCIVHWLHKVVSQLWISVKRWQTADLSTTPWNAFLPSTKDIEHVKSNMVVLLSWLLKKYIKDLSSLSRSVPQHISH